MKSSQFEFCFKAFIIAVFIVFCQYSLFGQTVICPREKIDGFDSENVKAKATLTKSKAVITSEINKAMVFVTYKRMPEGDIMYFHSNYKPIDFPFPIKIATNESLDLNLITSNIINIDRPHYGYDEAFRKNINFIVDYKIFYHSKFKNLDFGNATNIKIMDAKGFIHSDGLKIYETQKELKRIGLYKGLPDGVPGKKTESAIAAFKKVYGIEGEGKIYVRSRNNTKVVNYKDPEEFLEKFETLGEDCKQPLSICFDEDFVASFLVECNGQTLEFSTEGELTLTATNSDETFTHTFSLKSEEISANYNYSNTETKYDDPVKFLKFYQSVSAINQELCKNSTKLCLGKATGISFESNCNGNSISTSTSGNISVTSKNGRSRTIQF